MNQGVQLSRVCKIVDHQSRQIEFACVYPHCDQSRFLCAKCLKFENHKHQQENNNHIQDNCELYDYLMNNYKNQKDQLQNRKKAQFSDFQQLMEEIKNKLNNINKIVEQGLEEQERQYKDYDNQILNMLQNVKNDGFNNLQDIELNMLINLDLEFKYSDISQNIQQQSNSIIQNAIKIQELCQSEFFKYHYTRQDQQIQLIKDAKYKMVQIYQNLENKIQSSTISNDLKYIVLGGGDYQLNIWNYTDLKLLKQIQNSGSTYYCKFSNDSKLLNVGSFGILYQYDADNKFNEIFKQEIHKNKYIYNIYCITNSLLLTSTYDGMIIKQILSAHSDITYGLYYNRNYNFILSGSNDSSIKIWNGNNGQLITNSYSNCCCIWNINYELKQLEKFIQINDSKQFIIYHYDFLRYIKVYSIEGAFICEFQHNVKKMSGFYIIQLESMKQIIIQGKNVLEICKLELDIIQ